MTKRAQAGFTLIELIIFIVVVGVGVAGILSVFNTSVKSSADPAVRKQAVALAESILEEILQKEYANPLGGVTVGAGAATAASRQVFDDVDDYKGRTATEISNMFATSLAPIPGYSIAIVVGDPAPVTGVNMKQVTVTVSKGIESISLDGWRADY